LATSSSSQHGSPSLSSADVATARKCVQMASDLYRKGIWTDERTVAILASGVSSPDTSVFAPAMKFFLNIEDIMAEDEKQKEEETWVSQQKINLHLYSSKTKVCSKIFCFAVQENIHLSKKVSSITTFSIFYFFRNDKGMLRGRRRIEPRHKKNMKRKYWGKKLPMDLWIVYKNRSVCIRLLNYYGIHRD
jgi:hypothetical protein